MPYRQGSVVFIEDDVLIGQLVDDALTDEGFRVVVLSSFTTALRWLIATPKEPCLILLDVLMPDMSVDDFLRVYRELDAEQAPLVLCTADDRAIARQSELGAAATLAKPFDIDALVTLVKDHCDLPDPTAAAR